MTASSHASFCRVCQQSCPVMVTVDDGRVVDIAGDPENPVFERFTCVKGRKQGALYDSPGRLRQSLKRQSDGSYRPIPVESAMDEIAERLAAILEEHGPRAIASYIGTQGYYPNPATSPVLAALMKGIGSPMQFDPKTIDQPGKFIAKGLHGAWQAPPRGIHEPQAALLIGCNPLVSYQGLPIGNPGKFLKRAFARGFDLIVIDPRATSTARRATIHLQPRPGTDVAILAGMVNVILTEELYDSAFVAAEVDGLEQLRRAVAGYSPERVAAVAQISELDLVRAARLFAAAEVGYAMAGTGPSMSGNGTVVEYLVLCLDTLCGHWMRPGDHVPNASTVIASAAPKAQASAPVRAYDIGEPLRARGLWGSLAGLPVTALPEEILTPGPGQVRGLLSAGGSPVTAWPDQLKAIEALRALQLLVHVDIQQSPTARLADYVIASKLAFEMPGFTYYQDALAAFATGYGLTESIAQYTPAVVDPPEGAEVIEPWKLFHGLAVRLGIELELGPPSRPLRLDHQPSTDELFAFMAQGSRIPLDVVKAHPHGARFPEPSVHVLPKDPGWSSRLDVGNPDMMGELTRLGGADGEPKEDEAFPFRLLCRRLAYTMNSPTYEIPGSPHNPAFMNPLDLADLSVASGDVVRVVSRRSSIFAIAELDADVTRGMVSMPHGFGGLPEDDADFASIGSPTGRLLDADNVLDRFSGQPMMSNVPVRIEAT